MPPAGSHQPLWVTQAPLEGTVHEPTRCQRTWCGCLCKRIPAAQVHVTPHWQRARGAGGPSPSRLRSSEPHGAGPGSLVPQAGPPGAQNIPRPAEQTARSPQPRGTARGPPPRPAPPRPPLAPLPPGRPHPPRRSRPCRPSCGRRLPPPRPPSGPAPPRAAGARPPRRGSGTARPPPAPPAPPRASRGAAGGSSSAGRRQQGALQHAAPGRGRFRATARRRLTRKGGYSP